MIKRVDIEGLVNWAYREELPKAVDEESWAKIGYMRSGWASISSFGTLLSVVDVNRFDVVPYDESDEPPHPDAIVLHQAVMALEEFELDLPDGWCPMPELEDMGDLGRNAINRAIDSLTSVDKAGRRRLRRGPAALVRRQALLGAELEWRGPTPELRVAKGENGRPLWFRRHSMHSLDAFGQPVEWTYEQPDGWDVARKRPKRGAYQKNELYPDPLPVLVGRAEYEIWHSALSLLADELGGRLSEHEALPPSRPSQPWEVAGAPAPRILVSKQAVVG